MLHGVRARLLCALIVAAVSNQILHAEPLRQISARGYVSDLANLLDPASMDSIDELCYRLDYWANTQLNTITVPSLGEDLSQPYALQLFKGLSSESPESGKRRIVILFASRERKFTIIAGGEVRPLLSGRVRRYQREVDPYLKGHQDGAAIALMAKRIAEDIAADAEVGLKEVNSEAPFRNWSPVAQPYDVLTKSLRAMFILWLVAVVVIILMKTLRHRRPAKSELTLLVVGNEPRKPATT
jgi:uncharacterized membrane protein YgcG